MLFEKYDGKDVSVYAKTETIDEFIDLFNIELDNEEDLDDVLNSKYAVLSRVYGMYLDEEYWVVEPLIYNGEQCFNECEVMLVEKGISNVIDFKKVEYYEIDQFEGVVTYTEEFIDDEKDYIGDWLDDIIEDLFYELENSEDEYAYLIFKSRLKAIYLAGKDDMASEIAEYCENRI